MFVQACVMLSGSCLLSLACLVFCFHRYDLNQPAGGQRAPDAPGGIAAGAVTPREAPASRTTLAAGRAARPLRFFFRYTNHMTSDSIKTGNKRCPLTVGGWIASDMSI